MSHNNYNETSYSFYPYALESGKSAGAMEAQINSSYQSALIAFEEAVRARPMRTPSEWNELIIASREVVSTYNLGKGVNALSSWFTVKSRDSSHLGHDEKPDPELTRQLGPGLTLIRELYPEFVARALCQKKDHWSEFTILRQAFGLMGEDTRFSEQTKLWSGLATAGEFFDHLSANPEVARFGKVELPSRHEPVVQAAAFLHNRVARFPQRELLERYESGHIDSDALHAELLRLGLIATDEAGRWRRSVWGPNSDCPATSQQIKVFTLQLAVIGDTLREPLQAMLRQTDIG